jgi:hypothetical protein
MAALNLVPIPGLHRYQHLDRRDARAHLAELEVHERRQRRTERYLSH